MFAEHAGIVKAILVPMCLLPSVNTVLTLKQGQGFRKIIQNLKLLH